MNILHSNPDFTIVDLALPTPGHEITTSVYLLKTSKIALIDCGPAVSLPLLFDGLKQLNIDPENVDYILATHIHLDHLGGLGQALKRMPQAKVIVHPKGIPHLINPRRLWQGSLDALGEVAVKYGQPEPVDASRLISAEEGQQIDLGSLKLEVLLTPGHAPHHLSLLERNHGFLFAGEAAGIYFPEINITRPASPPPFDLDKTLDSLAKLIATNPHSVFYCHYGVSSHGVQTLNQYHNALELWLKVTTEYFKPGLTLDQPMIDSVIDKVTTLDGTRDIIAAYRGQRLTTELFFLGNSVRGFWTYCQNNYKL